MAVLRLRSADAKTFFHDQVTLQRLREKKERGGMRQKFWELGGSRMMAAMRVKEVKEGSTDTGISDDVKVKEQEEGDDGGEVDYRWVHTWFRSVIMM